MSQELVPLDYSFDSDMIPMQQTPALEPGLYQGLHIICSEENREWLLEVMRRWFADFDEIIIVGSGTTAMEGNGFIVLEWEECEIDRIILSIIKNDPNIIDFSVYIRDAEV